MTSGRAAKNIFCINNLVAPLGLSDLCKRPALRVQQAFLEKRPPFVALMPSAVGLLTHLRAPSLNLALDRIANFTGLP
jgi:hypothetical protein